MMGEGLPLPAKGPKGNSGEDGRAECMPSCVWFHTDK